MDRLLWFEECREAARQRAGVWGWAIGFVLAVCLALWIWLVVEPSDLVIGGGVESMSRVPMGSDGGAWATDPAIAIDTYFVPQGISADLIATRWGFSREDCDAYAAESQRRAAAAWEAGYFDRSVIPVHGHLGEVLLDKDEHVRPGTTVETLANMRPAFKKDGTVTAGNASGLNDGAAFMVLASADAASRSGLQPIARVVSYAVAGVPNEIMGEGPIPASKMVMEKAGLTLDDMDVIESNEAFAAQAIAVSKGLGLDMEKTNPNGGAIALGHPIGCSGAFIATKALYELQRIDGRYALVTMCIGGGQGIAVIFERL